MCVAQQEAQRAFFIVEKAEQERQEKVVRAEGEAEAAKLISFFLKILFPTLFPSSTLLPLLASLNTNACNDMVEGGVVID